MARTSLSPSPRTWRRLGITTAAAGAIAFWYLSADYDCGAQVWTCSSFLGLGVVSVLFGVAFGALYTALAVLLGPLIHALRPSATTLEPAGKVPAVVLSMLAAQLVAVGALHLAGALPVGWPWWLGVFGAYVS